LEESGDETEERKQGQKKEDEKKGKTFNSTGLGCFSSLSPIWRILLCRFENGAT